MSLEENKKPVGSSFQIVNFLNSIEMNLVILHFWTWSVKRWELFVLRVCVTEQLGVRLQKQLNPNLFYEHIYNRNTGVQLYAYELKLPVLQNERYYWSVGLLLSRCNRENGVDWVDEELLRICSSNINLILEIS